MCSEAKIKTVKMRSNKVLLTHMKKEKVDWNKNSWKIRKELKEQSTESSIAVALRCKEQIFSRL